MRMVLGLDRLWPLWGCLVDLPVLLFMFITIDHLCKLPHLAACPVRNVTWCHCHANDVICSPSNKGKVPKFHYEPKTYNTIYLTHQNLEMIHSSAFYDIQVEKIVLDHNPLRRTISVKALQGLADVLEEMSICHTQMFQLYYGLFVGMKRLKYLYIWDNDLSFLPASTFQGADQLLELYLWGNKIEHLDEHIFIGLANLRKLDLENNRISKLTMDVFRRLPKLEALFLGNNFIQSIDRYTFQHNTNLKVLRLHNNGLIYLREEAFQGLSNLLSLQLNDNKIAIVWEELFDPLENLTTLYMQYNLIDHLFGGIFRKCKKLHKLNLSFNLVKHLPHGSFRHLNRLKILYLDGNRLGTVHRGAVAHWGRLKTLYVSGNPLKCDCRIWWMHEIIKRGGRVWGTCLHQGNPTPTAVSKASFSMQQDCHRKPY